MGQGSLTYVFVVAVGAMIADACLQCAHAQCAPGTQIFIDPRLAPQRPQVSRQQFDRVMSSPWASPEEKRRVADLYYGQSQPIEVPFRGGAVLISPKDPCVQQYIGN